MKRMKRPIRKETADVQCGFTEGKGTTNAIFIMRNVIERSIEVQKDLYLCFTDYSKAFDKDSAMDKVSILVTDRSS